jgi:penicillin-binding protein 1B
MSRARKTTSRRRRKARSRSRLLRWFLAAAVAAAAALAVYTVLLDREVRERFEGKRWALPARVYARPLELYPGAPVAAEALVRELELLRYRRASDVREPGTYGVRGGEVLVLQVMLSMVRLLLLIKDSV